MPSVSPPSRPYSDRIVPGWLWPQTQDAAATAADAFTAAHPVAEQNANEYRVAAGQLADLTAGEMSDAMVAAHQHLAVDHDNHAEILGHLQRAAQQVGHLDDSLAASLDSIDQQAHQAIAAAPPEEREGIIAAAHAAALTAHQGFTQSLVDYYTYAAGIVDPLAGKVIGRTPAPTDNDPTVQALDDGTTPQHRGDKIDAKNQGAADTGPSGMPGGSAPVGSFEPRGDDQSPAPAGGRVESPTPTPIGTWRHRENFPNAPITPSPPSPLAGVPGGLGGGMPGGGLPTGMLQGLGGGSPLSGLTSGLGQVPGSAPAGLGNVPAAAGGMPNAAAQAVQAGPGLAQGLSSAAGVGGAGVAPAAPATAAPTSVGDAGAPAAAAASSSAPPAAAAASSVPESSALSAGAAHAAEAAGPAGAAPMLLPPPPMGSPAAPDSAPVAMPAGSSSTSASAAAAPATAPAATAGTAGPTLVPAGVVSPVDPRPRRAPADSPDLAAAKALVWELSRNSAVKYPGIAWAVGVFRSPSGSETVVMSNEGSGYVPVGVYLPRSARLLVADPLVDKAFRDRWFGWADPARVLLQYADLRADGDWKLVTAATSGPVDAFKGVGVEYAQCPPERSPLSEHDPPTVLDELHVHRLQLEYPDLYDRLGHLADAGWGYQSQLAQEIERAMIEQVRSLPMDVPEPLRKMWPVLNGDNEPTAAMWREYVRESQAFNLTLSAKRPGFGATAPEQAPDIGYRRLWFVARTMEFLSGWADQPIPLADMVYNAAAADTVDFRERIGSTLARVEMDIATNEGRG